MNEIDLLKKLDAASPDVGEIDVTARVMRQIRSTPFRVVESSPMWIGALLSGVAAAAVQIGRAHV